METTRDISRELREWITTEALSARPDIVLQDSTELLRNGYLDSLLLLRLVAFIGDRFGIEVPDEDVLPANFRTVEAMTGFIIDLQKKQAALES
jgi:acyl carrier protein